MGNKMWQVQINISEVDRMTRVEARLSGKDSEELVGQGTARCNPADENVPSIGDELATARALSDLAHQLLHAAAKDIEAHTHERVQRLRT
ncbi:protein of unknown function (DUF1876) [Streptoalloteichus tenebrarius]|uniref:DUF1876 domain-containing protein n=1 Tax=Streptoalloteichus tenebrarius (strain ATCC 17920 / DSM 40477 / JCM 4838 / CBS 697.72 / NBRC 16177 / NCIMB 11028 / NRRL B-12390 / A12253. 1 / ISP 5477) TaxID=1933 RepID=A0ABT1I113_STRSD|nr:DUF1876 domain-containing protein [Streptoalloteichus tenebrarius]MCP2261467.1 protein of unknown function (DUF1876) [Streptoalloteichus tenebrarius]BFE99703.1 DUF1876 domain-containing protein [Streptoalloteichus tenebrarius]